MFASARRARIFGQRLLSASTAAPRSSRGLAMAGGAAVASAAAFVGYNFTPVAECKQARYNVLMPAPPGASIKCCVVEFNVSSRESHRRHPCPRMH